MAKGRKVVASTDDYTIYQRRDGRYAVENAEGGPVNAEAKIEILLKHDLIKAVLPAAEEPEPEAAEESGGDEEGGDAEASTEDEAGADSDSSDD